MRVYCVPVVLMDGTPERGHHILVIPVRVPAICLSDFRVGGRMLGGGLRRWCFHRDEDLRVGSERDRGLVVLAALVRVVARQAARRPYFGEITIKHSLQRRLFHET